MNPFEIWVKLNQLKRTAYHLSHMAEKKLITSPCDLSTHSPSGQVEGAVVSRIDRVQGRCNAPVETCSFPCIGFGEMPVDKLVYFRLKLGFRSWMGVQKQGMQGKVSEEDQGKTDKDTEQNQLKGV